MVLFETLLEYFYLFYWNPNYKKKKKDKAHSHKVPIYWQ